MTEKEKNFVLNIRTDGIYEFYDEKRILLEFNDSFKWNINKNSKSIVIKVTHLKKSQIIREEQ